MAMSTQQRGGKNTPQYKLLLKYASKINKVLTKANENIILLSADLHEAGLISETNDLEMRNQFVSITLRAANLTGMVRGKVELSTENFDKFIKALENHNDIFKEILEELKKGDLKLIIINYCEFVLITCEIILASHACINLQNCPEQ